MRNLFLSATHAHLTLRVVIKREPKIYLEYSSYQFSDLLDTFLNMTQQKASVGESVLPNTVNTVPPTTPSEHSDTEHLFPTTSPLLSQGNIILQTPERVSYGSSSSSKEI